MTDPVWPATLPQRPLVQGFRKTFGDGAIRNQMDSGPPITRKRFTATVKTYQMAFRLTFAQVAILEAFYETDCAMGAVPFQMADPITGVTQRWTFKEAPNVTPIMSQTAFDASVQLEALPA